MQCSRIIAAILIASLIVPASGATPSKAKSKSKTSAKKSASKRPSAASKAAQRKHVLTAAEQARARRMKRAFVASAELKPMAQQLLDGRSAAAYKGVEKFASTHANTDEGALAWLLLGYARATDNNPDYERAIEALKAAKPHASDLSDYVDFLLATAYRGKGSSKDVVLALEGFSKRHPTSVLRRDAAVMLAAAYLNTASYEDAVTALDMWRKPAKADVEMLVGRAYLGAGQNQKAIEIFRNVYYNMPLSSGADEAGANLKKLVAGGEYGNLELRKTRAQLLANGKAYQQAITEYRALIKETDSAELKVALARTLEKINRDAEARDVLLAVDANTLSPEAKAQRLYLLAEISRGLNDDAAQLGYVNELIQTAPNSSWLQEALFSMGNKFLLRREFAQAATYYDEVAHRFPSWKGGTAHWKSAWLRYRLKDFNAAKEQFEQQVLLFPTSAEVPNALYWRGRIAEQENEIPTARAFYKKLSERYRNYYYALLARERLQALGEGEIATVAALQRLGGAMAPATLSTADGVENIRLQKSRLLTNAALYDYAVRELQAAATEDGNDWAALEIARVQEDAGRYYAALQTLKRMVPGYFSVDIQAFPRPIAERLFPRPFWDALEKYAVENGLDPYLVASLIRQESEFNPMAISHANAYGLMQLLPEVGRSMAKEVKLKPYSTASLLEPVPNLRLGTRYFKQMIEGNGGKVEYALAAYNAGSNRVTDWLANGQYQDMPEFVESIPFTETREYVQAILRNVQVYRKLYGQPGGSATTAAAGATR